MQNEIVSAMDLLDGSGRITREGWARYPYWRYDRAKIRSNALRIKEWDYYSALSQDGRFGIALTMSDLGVITLYSIHYTKLYEFPETPASPTISPGATSRLTPSRARLPRSPDTRSSRIDRSPRPSAAGADPPDSTRGSSTSWPVISAARSAGESYNFV